MKTTTRCTLVMLGMATALVAQEPAAAPAPAIAATPPIAIGSAPAVVAPVVEKSEEKASEAAKPDPIKAEHEKLSTENNLAAERLKAETNAIREEITKLKREKELLAERIALAATKRQADE